MGASFTSFATASVPNAVTFITGSYTGNGSNNRDLDIGLNPGDFDTWFFEVDKLEAYHKTFKNSDMNADESKDLNTATVETDNFVQVNSTGFRITDDADINDNTVTYYYRFLGIVNV